MSAVAAARQWWVARRRRIISLAQIGLAMAIVGCAVAGFCIARDNARRVSAGEHTALAQALDQLHAMFGDIHDIDGGALRFVAQQSGLRDLRFAADPTPDRGREFQSLLDARGRIIGWFSWAPDRALVATMDWLWALAGVLGAALVFCTFVAGRAMRRLMGALAHSAERTRRLTRDDALTGLPNQRVVLENLDRRLSERQGASNGQLAFALIDLDGLREVNDTLGRNGGNEVLVTIAERFRAVLPQAAELGRFEDDEFAVIAAVADADAAMELAGKLRAALREPIVVGQKSAGQVCQVSAGIGIALAPADGTSAEDVARRGALALNAAKQDGHGAVRRFAPQIESEHADRRFLLRELKAAIAAQAFALHYQPIVAAAGGAIIGVEALLRWQHPTRGAIAPSVFVPLAEQHGLMQELGDFVLQRALADAARWGDLFVAVNLSPVQIRDPHLVDRVGGIIAATGIAASRVVLEVTEGVLVEDPQEMQTRLEALHALGVTMALDDFGTGYSSLSYLQRFPFHRLKIDRAFVAALGTVGNAGAIIHSIVTLGHALGMIVLGEGVETEQQRVLLRLAGCDEMQGFLFARPRPAEAIDKIVARLAPPRGAAAAEPVS